MKITKPYITINKDYYIQLRIQELGMCNWINKVCYCEELFLVKHETKHNCESALFYKLDKDTIRRSCHFRYFIIQQKPQVFWMEVLRVYLLTCLAIKN